MRLVKKIIIHAAYLGWLKWVPDKMFLKLIYRISTGRHLNLENPTRFNEKLQWLKLYYHNPIMTEMADKYTARGYIKRKVGEQYLVPLIGVWDNVDDVKIEELPEKFVIKSTNDSGGLAICKDKKEMNWPVVREKLRKTLNTNYFYSFREWPYKNGKPRIIAEEIIEDKTSNYLKDYKFFCFNGEVKCFYITSNRGMEGGLKIDYFDLEWNHLPITHYQYQNNKFEQFEKPENFEEMVEVATKLSEGIPHVRVDLYNIEGKIYAGEMTFFSDAGIGELKPEEYNIQFGQWLALPEKMIGD